MSTSCFLYMHKDMSGQPDVWKVGVSKSPYSAVRARQKFSWAQFGLEYLYFGSPAHIKVLEQAIKDEFYKYSGSWLNNIGSQTELLKIDVDKIRNFASAFIKTRFLFIIEVSLPTPYTASNSGSCPFGIPIEGKIDEWAHQKLIEIFEEHYNDTAPVKLKYLGRRCSAIDMFKELFSEQ